MNVKSCCDYGISIEIVRVVGVTNFGKGISSEKVLLNIF